MSAPTPRSSTPESLLDRRCPATRILAGDQPLVCATPSSTYENNALLPSLNSNVAVPTGVAITLRRDWKTARR